MTEPLKPRIDFDGPLEVDQNPKFRAQQTFDENQAQNFAPATLDEAQEEEGQVEAVMDAALRPKRSLWRKMVMGGLALFGASVVGQGVQWTMNAWQTQDWVALGGCAAGALIIGAGVGSVVTEWRRLWRLRQRAMNAMKRAICCTVTARVKAVHSAKNWRSRRASISHIRRCSAGMPQSMKRRTIVKWSVCMLTWSSQF